MKHENNGSQKYGTGICLALRPREAAEALGIGRRKLWAMTNSGEIPHARIGRAVVYPVHELQAWLSKQSEMGVAE